MESSDQIIIERDKILFQPLKIQGISGDKHRKDFGLVALCFNCCRVVDVLIKFTPKYSTVYGNLDLRNTERQLRCCEFCGGILSTKNEDDIGTVCFHGYLDKGGINIAKKNEKHGCFPAIARWHSNSFWFDDVGWWEVKDIEKILDTKDFATEESFSVIQHLMEIGKIK